ncbi:hypothetical protein DPEC_G00365540 [Dallia pectoralis]|nr:hypothetical protein DPEC_G00365540 [Dallia pectoralis]
MGSRFHQLSWCQVAWKNKQILMMDNQASEVVDLQSNTYHGRRAHGVPIRTSKTPGLTSTTLLGRWRIWQGGSHTVVVFTPLGSFHQCTHWPPTWLSSRAVASLLRRLLPRW